MLRTALSLIALISILLMSGVPARSDQCPLTIASVTLAAKGATGASVLYRIDLLSPDAQPRWASFRIRVSDAEKCSGRRARRGIEASYIVTLGTELSEVNYKFGD